MYKHIDAFEVHCSNKLTKYLFDFQTSFTSINLLKC